MMKKLWSVFLGGVFAVTSLSATACRKKVPDSEDFLQVYCVNFGYGTDWVDAIAESSLNRTGCRKNIPAPR